MILNRDQYTRSGQRRRLFKDTPSAPATPDYTGAAQATASGNLDAARLAAKANRVNTYTPYGDITYAQSPSDQDLWSANVTLDPTQQKLLDQQNQTSLSLAGLQDQAFNKVSDQLNVPTPEAYDPTKATNTAYDSLMSRLNPQYDNQQSQLNQNLANQGITLGSEAWNNAQNQFGQTRNDAQTQAALNAINLGMQQQGQTYSQESTNANAPLNTLNAIRTGSQVTNPTQVAASPQSTTAGTNYLGAAQATGSADQNLYNQQVGATNSANSSTAGIAGSIGSAALLFF